MQSDPHWHYVQETMQIQEEALPMTDFPVAVIGCGRCCQAAGWMVCMGAGLQRSCWCPCCRAWQEAGHRLPPPAGRTHCTEAASGHWLAEEKRERLYSQVPHTLTGNTIMQ